MAAKGKMQAVHLALEVSQHWLQTQKSSPMAPPILPICTLRSASVAFSLCNSVFVASYESAHAKLFDAVTGKERFRFAAAKAISAVVFLPDGKHVILAEQYHRAGIWSLTDGALIGKKWTLGKKSDELKSFLNVESSSQILYAGGYGGLSILDYEGLVVDTIVVSDHKPRNVAITKVALSPSDDAVAVAWNTCHPLASEYFLSVFEWPSRKFLCDLSSIRRQTGGQYINQLKFLDADSLFVANDESSGVFSVNGKPRQKFAMLDQHSWPYMYQPTNEFADGGDDGIITFRDSSTLDVTRQIQLEGKWAVDSISQDGRLISLFSTNGTHVFKFQALLDASG